MAKAEAIAARPDFPWLDIERPEGIWRFLAQRGWVLADERLVRCEKAGDGNMNLTVRVWTDRRSVILKQARPWVEKYEHIAASPDRAVVEERFYRRVASIPGVASRMPKLLAADATACALLLEDLCGARDLTAMYRGETLDDDDLRRLASYLRVLHTSTTGDPDPHFANRAMRALNHEHIFRVPLDPAARLDLDRFEAGLAAAARHIQAHKDFAARVAETGKRYLADGRCLVHGDFFPGSWLNGTAANRNDAIWVIDPEFCFHGDAELDVGCAVAHLALGRQELASARSFVEFYSQGDQTKLDGAWVGRYAAVEVMRRLIGVAQLPIVFSSPFRVKLLERARSAMLDENWERLWS